MRAVERGDATTAAHYVNLARVQVSLTEQITEAYLQRTGARSGPLVHGAVGALADPIVYKLISPEAFTELSAHRLAARGRPRGAVQHNRHHARWSRNRVWQLFVAAEYGIGRYEVTVPVGVPPERAFMLQFRLAQWRWQLAAVRVPEPIRLLLADEIIKSTKSLQPPHGSDQSSSPSALRHRHRQAHAIVSALGAPRDPA